MATTLDAVKWEVFWFHEGVTQGTYTGKGRTLVFDGERDHFAEIHAREEAQKLLDQDPTCVVQVRRIV